jgi:hypothetical protein
VSRSASWSSKRPASTARTPSIRRLRRSRQSSSAAVGQALPCVHG